MPSIRHALALLPATVAAITFSCEHVRADGKSFNLEKLGGPKQVHWPHKEADFEVNTTFTIDLCHAMKPDGDVAKDHRCNPGVRVCGIERDKSGDEWKIREVINVAGEFATSTGGHLDPQITRLKGSASNSDTEKEGLRVEFNGGSRNGVDTRATIELQCDRDKEGNEGFVDTGKMLKTMSYARMGRREDETSGEEDEKNGEPSDLDKGKALQFISFKLEEKTEVLRLDWKTKWACEDAWDQAGAKKGGWGFFTWFLIIVFLAAAAYIIFGSWLNYNRYGARGWDLIPHGDTIRDLPYIVKDLGSGMMSKLGGSGGSRGGYSAV